MNLIYSDSLHEMVVNSFYYEGEKFVWNDLDCLYYSEDSDESWLYDIPLEATY